MSESLLETMRRVQAEKEAMTDGAESALEVGEVWVRALCERHGLDVDDLAAADALVADITIRTALAAEGYPLRLLLAIAHASGFTNGLVCALERR